MKLLLDFCIHVIMKRALFSKFKLEICLLYLKVTAPRAKLYLGKINTIRPNTKYVSHYNSKMLAFF